MHVTRLMLQLKSLLVLCICITRYLLGHRLLCVVHLCELHHESPGCCCIGATLEQHHGYGMWGYALALLRLCYSYVTAAAKTAVSARREAVLRLLCQPGENKCACSSYSSSSLIPAFELTPCPLMWRSYPLEKTLMLGKIEGKRRRGWQRRDG